MGSMDGVEKKRSWLFPAVAGAIVVVLVGIALVRKPVELDPTTPEGTVQVYLQAIADEDYQVALDQTSEEIRNSCTAGDISDNNYYETFTATLGEVEEFGERVQVEATLNTQSDVFFDPGYGYRETFVLIEEGGRWVITENPWPSFTYGCNP